MKISSQFLCVTALLACCSAMRIAESMRHKTHNKIRSKKSQGEMKSEFFQKIK